MSAIGGRATAARAAPTGTDVCRTAMAVPRRSPGNQVSTARPLAAFTPAPDAPASASSAPAVTGSSTSAVAPSAPAAPTNPIVITPRSPNRSARGAPRDQGDDEADGDRADHRPDTGQTQSEVDTQGRGDGSEAEEVAGRGGLGGRTHGQHHPAVAGRVGHLPTVRRSPNSWELFPIYETLGTAASKAAGRLVAVDRRSRTEGRVHRGCSSRSGDHGGLGVPRRATVIDVWGPRAASTAVARPNPVIMAARVAGPAGVIDIPGPRAGGVCGDPKPVRRGGRRGAGPPCRAGEHRPPEAPSRGRSRRGPCAPPPPRPAPRRPAPTA